MSNRAVVRIHVTKLLSERPLSPSTPYRPLSQSSTYRLVIDDVIANVRQDFEDMGIEREVLEELQRVSIARLFIVLASLNRKSR